jgi:hypothetical protein
MDSKLERNRMAVAAFFAQIFNDCRPRQTGRTLRHWDMLQRVPATARNCDRNF